MIKKSKCFLLPAVILIVVGAIVFFNGGLSYSHTCPSNQIWDGSKCILILPPTPTPTSTPIVTPSTNGFLSVKSIPVGASITLSGGHYGITDRDGTNPLIGQPGSFISRRPGTYTLVVSKTGYKPVSEIVVFTAGKTVYKSYTLVPDSITVPATPTPAPTTTPTLSGNLIMNSGFEFGSTILTDWRIIGNLTAQGQWTTVMPHTGSKAIKLYNTNVVAGRYGSVIYNTKVPVLPNTKYTFSAWIKGNGLTLDTSVTLYGMSATGSYNGQNTKLVYTSGTYGWKQVTSTITTGSTTYGLKPMFSTSGLGEFYIDDVTLSKVI